ncbi:MAG: class I adenylate-forming enzyme family protein [Aggregatilineales bacterium]
MNIGLLPTRQARYRPDHLAVVVGNTRLTYREYNQHINRIANALRGLGVQKGDKVATILPNCLELLEVYWAVAKIGAVVVPLSPLLRAQALATLLTDSDSATVITNQSMIAVVNEARRDCPGMAPDRYILTDAADQPGYRYYHALTASASDQDPVGIEIGDADVYNIIYSSGTTGLPKGIVHTHAIRGMYCTLFSAAYRITPESIVLHAGSIIFNGAFLTLMPAMFAGATYILMTHPDPAAIIDTIAREQVTHIKTVPSQIIAMLNAPNFSPEALQSLEMLGSVGAPLHKEYKAQLAHKLPGIFYELYGLTEGFVTILDKHEQPDKLLSVGCPPPFFEMRIVDEHDHDLPPGQVGEIVGRGPLLMTGYYKRPDLTAQVIVGGWLHSGDMGYVDEDGFLYLVDRKKDLIISGGVNVYPRDIEEIVVQHPAVREAAVFGIPSDKWGETPLAAVVLRQPGTTTPQALKQWINERVEARYQQVYDVVIMDDFPRNVAGKTLKRVMRDEYWAKRGEKI